MRWVRSLFVFSRGAVRWWVAVAALVGFAQVAVLVATAGTAPYTAVGNGDPGTLVRWGTPLLRLVVDLSATLCTGSLVFAAFFVLPGNDGQLTAHGYAAVRTAGRWGLVWLVAAVVFVPFDVSDTVGEPLSLHNTFALLGALEEPRAWLVTAVVVLVVTVGAWLALRWATTVGLVALAVLALLPPLVTGHASSDAGHDLASTALLWHVPAAAIWLGVLVAFLVHVARTGDVSSRGRYVRVATWCWAIVITTGVVDALVLVPVEQFVRSTYGWLVLASAAVAVVLGVAVVRWRRDRSMAWFVAAELVLLAVAFGIAAGLTHLPPPSFARPVSAQETLLGYDLAGPPTVVRLLLDWRLDLVFAPIAVLLAVGYLVCVRRAPGWSVWRTVSWLSGCVLVLMSTSSGIGRYATAMFSMHMTSHMLLSMAAPLLLVLGAPLTLLHATVRGDLRDWLLRLFASPFVRALTHPVVALVLFAGSPFLLYFTGLFDAAVRFHWAHTVIGVWFFVAGLLFAWVVVGVDPTPRRLPNLARLGMLLAAMPSDTVFAAVLLTTHRVVGNGAAGDNQYQALALPWVHDLLSDQRVAGIVALAITEVTLLGAVIVLLSRWFAAEDDDVEETLLAGLR